MIYKTRNVRKKLDGFSRTPRSSKKRIIPGRMGFNGKGKEVRFGKGAGARGSHNEGVFCTDPPGEDGQMGNGENGNKQITGWREDERKIVSNPPILR